MLTKKIEKKKKTIGVMEIAKCFLEYKFYRYISMHQKLQILDGKS